MSTRHIDSISFLDDIREFCNLSDEEYERRKSEIEKYETAYKDVEPIFAWEFPDNGKYIRPCVFEKFWYFREMVGKALPQDLVIYISQTMTDLYTKKHFSRCFVGFTAERAAKKQVPNFGVTRDSQGRYIVADMRERAVKTFAPDGSDPILFSDAGSLYCPLGVYLNEAADRLYVVCNTNSCHVYRYSTRTLLEILKAGARKNESEKSVWFGIAGTKDGLVYISDTLANEITVFNGSEQLYAFARGEVLGPNGLAVDEANNTLLVADWGNCVITIYDLKTSPPTLLRRIKKCGRFKYSCPSGIAVDKDSNIYISDTNVIQVFDISGRLSFETEAEAFGISYSMEHKEITVTRNHCDHKDHGPELFCSQIQSYTHLPRPDEL